MDEKETLYQSKQHLACMMLHNETLKRVIRERDKTQAELYIFQKRLAVIVKLAMTSKSLNKLEKESIMVFLNSWDEEDRISKECSSQN